MDKSFKWFTANLVACLVAAWWAEWSAGWFSSKVVSGFDDDCLSECVWSCE